MRASSDIEDELRTLVAARFGVSVVDVVGTASLLDDLGADSLDLVSLILDIEAELGIDIPDEDAVQLETFSELVDYVEFAVAAEETEASRQVTPLRRAG